MPEHLTFFGEFTNQTEDLYWTLQELYGLERKESLTPDQKSTLIRYRLATKEKIRQFRELLISIEREHQLEPEQVIRPAIID